MNAFVYPLRASRGHERRHLPTSHSHRSRNVSSPPHSPGKQSRVVFLTCSVPPARSLPQTQNRCRLLFLPSCWPTFEKFAPDGRECQSQAKIRRIKSERQKVSRGVKRGFVFCSFELFANRDGQSQNHKGGSYKCLHADTLSTMFCPREALSSHFIYRYYRRNEG